MILLWSSLLAYHHSKTQLGWIVCFAGKNWPDEVLAHVSVGILGNCLHT